MKQALGAIRYRVRIQGPRVTVTRYAGDADYSEEVLETFARFQQGAVKSYLVRLTALGRDEPRRGANPRRRRPAASRRVRSARATTATRHRDYLDATFGGSTARCSSTSPTSS